MTRSGDEGLSSQAPPPHPTQKGEGARGPVVEKAEVGKMGTGGGEDQGVAGGIGEWGVWREWGG